MKSDSRCAAEWRHIVLGLGEEADFGAQKFVRRTELPLITKLFAENKTPPIANVLLVAAHLVSIINI